MSIEFLQIAEAVAREKDIEKQQVVEVMEAAIASAAARKYGRDLNVQCVIDPVTGDVTLKKLKEVVNVVMEPISYDEVRLAQREDREPEMRAVSDGKGFTAQENANQITLKKAKEQNPDIKLGEFLMEDLPPIDFGRVAAVAAKQAIVQKVRDVERAREFVEYEHSIGTVISGIVKRSDHRGVLVDLGRAEAFMPKEETIPREMFNQGDRVRAYIYKVQEGRGAQIYISRTHPNFLLELFKEQIPEVQNGSVELLNAARDPGFRAKISVKANDANLDPVGVCVGVRGVRVNAVTQELQGERVDIINYSANPADFLVKAMQPATVTKVVLDEDENRIEVVVPEDNLSLAIGRRGQNVRLASILTGWDIDVMSEAEESERRTQEVKVMTENFIAHLDVDDVLSRLLIAEGFRSVDDLLKVDVEELAAIEGFNPEIAAELQARAQDYLDAAQKKLAEAGITDELKNFGGMNADLLEVCRENGLKELDDLADLATDELLDMCPPGLLTPKSAEKLIMSARAKWFAEDEEEDEEAA